MPLLNEQAREYQPCVVSSHGQVRTVGKDAANRFLIEEKKQEAFQTESHSGTLRQPLLTDDPNQLPVARVELEPLPFLLLLFCEEDFDAVRVGLLGIAVGDLYAGQVQLPALRPRSAGFVTGQGGYQGGVIVEAHGSAVG